MNYNLAVDSSNFKPYTFDDLMKPVTAYKEDYDKLETKMEDYIDKYGNVVLPSTVDLKYRDMVDLYHNDFNSVVDAMTSNSPLASYRNNATKLFLRGRSDMAPLKKAVEEYTKLMDELGELKRKDSSLIVTKEPDLNSIIADYLGSGTTTKKYNYVNGKEFGAILNTGITSLLKQLPDKVEVKGVNGQYNNIIKSSELSASDIMDLVRGNKLTTSNSPKVLEVANLIADFIESTKKAYGYNETDNAGRKQLDDWVYRSVLSTSAGAVSETVLQKPHTSNISPYAEKLRAHRYDVIKSTWTTDTDGNLTPRLDTALGRAQWAKLLLLEGKLGISELPDVLMYLTNGMLGMQIKKTKLTKYKPIVLDALIQELKKEHKTTTFEGTFYSTTNSAIVDYLKGVEQYNNAETEEEKDKAITRLQKALETLRDLVINDYTDVKYKSYPEYLRQVYDNRDIFGYYIVDLINLANEKVKGTEENAETFYKIKVDNTYYIIRDSDLHTTIDLNAAAKAFESTASNDNSGGLGMSGIGIEGLSDTGGLRGY